nr:hypothetical protein [Tanacetum cinerariifolium]
MKNQQHYLSPSEKKGILLPWSLRTGWAFGLGLGLDSFRLEPANIPIGGNISLEGFLLPILLLVVIIVMVVIVVVILIVVVAIIGVVVVVGDVILLACSIPIGWAYTFHQDKASLVRVPVVNVTLSSSAHLLRENTDSSSGDIVDLIGDEDPTDEDGDTKVSVSLGEISSEGKKSWELDIGDCDNTRDGEEGSDDEQACNEEEFIHLSLSTHAEEETRDEESFDPIPKTPEKTNNEGNGEENLEMNVGREEGQDEEDEEDELYRDININLGRGIQMGDVHTTQEFKDLHVTLTLFARAVSSIPGIVHRYMDQRMNEAVKVAVQLQSDILRDEAQKENDKFLKAIDENMQKIIKEQVKEQVK